MEAFGRVIDIRSAWTAEQGKSNSHLRGVNCKRALKSFPCYRPPSLTSRLLYKIVVIQYGLG